MSHSRSERPGLPATPTPRERGADGQFLPGNRAAVTHGLYAAGDVPAEFAHLQAEVRQFVADALVDEGDVAQVQARRLALIGPTSSAAQRPFPSAGFSVEIRLTRGACWPQSQPATSLFPSSGQTPSFFSFRPYAARSVARVAVGADVRPVRQARPLVADGLPAPHA